MKYWFVASYKINEVKRLELNLLNQKLDYYLPKITIKKINTSSKEEILFPGYIFLNTSLNYYSAIKYTKGIKSILKFGNNVPHIDDDEINKIREVEKSSKLDPITVDFKIGQEVTITKGSLKGVIVKICSLPAKKRVNVLISILGSFRKVNISEHDLKF